MICIIKSCMTFVITEDEMENSDPNSAPLYNNSNMSMYESWAKVNQHPPMHHPLDTRYGSVVDDLQLSYYLVSSQ